MRPAKEKKKVMVVGGGPSGLECARVAALRGHDVQLFEKSDSLGGQIYYAAKAPFGDQELYGVIKYLAAQCKKANVSMHLGTAVTAKTLEKQKPDIVVIATGARFLAPSIPGLPRSKAVSTLDVLDGKAKTGDKVIVLGGRKPGIAAALHLAKAGKKVTLVSRDRKVGKDVNPSYIWRYIQKLSQFKVTTYRESTLEEMTKTGAVIRALHDTRIPVAADMVVYAEREPISDLKERATSLGLEVHVIGDALGPRALSNALHDGYKTGLRL